MSLAMQRFRGCLKENHIKYHESRPDSNIITDIHVEENVFDPCWDIIGYEDMILFICIFILTSLLN